MSKPLKVKFAANFERNLADVEAFLKDAGLYGTFDALLDELALTVIPNLERFPSMGRLFSSRSPRSVEAANGMDRLKVQLAALGADVELREYILDHYLALYTVIGDTVYLLSIRHQRQLSFDFDSLWAR